ncbi:MAG: hypothetical protein Q9P01_06470 [Anaerolineae bacterium]|nr:hypothetical protein [Anaerolineae bacterium]MDQ7034476.1 hypothetical protein [Anaerolineae bacterium]
MAKRASVFSDEWRRCLREHYKYVIGKEDKATEETLLPILHRFGFRDDELRELYVEATMRDMPDDFVPDMERLVQESESTPIPETTFQVHPAECACPSCMDVVLEDGHDEEGQPLEEPQEIEVAQDNIFPVAKPEKDDEEDEKDNEDDLPKQKSLF